MKILKKSLNFITFLFFICLWSNIAHAAITLTYASNGPEQSIRGEAEKLFLDEIERQSNGKIKISAFWSNTLVSAPEALKAVQDGVVDMAFINPFFYPKALPFWNAIPLNSFGPTKGEEIISLYNELYDKIPELSDDLKKNKQFAPFIFASDCYSFVSTKKINNISQLKGLKSRASSRWKLADFNAMKSTPVSIPWSECYMSLQTKTIDTVCTSLESNHRGKLYEVAPYLWVWDKMWGGMPYLITININKFNKLDKELQDAIIKAGKIANQKFAQKYDSDIEYELKDMEKKGVIITYATEQDYRDWANLPSTKENFNTWLKEAKTSNLPNAEQVITNIKMIVESKL